MFGERVGVICGAGLRDCDNMLMTNPITNHNPNLNQSQARILVSKLVSPRPAFSSDTGELNFHAKITNVSS